MLTNKHNTTKQGKTKQNKQTSALIVLLMFHASALTIHPHSPKKNNQNLFPENCVCSTCFFLQGKNQKRCNSDLTSVTKTNYLVIQSVTLLGW